MHLWVRGQPRMTSLRMPTHSWDRVPHGPAAYQLGQSGRSWNAGGPFSASSVLRAVSTTQDVTVGSGDGIYVCFFFWWTMCFTTWSISSAPTMHNLLPQYWTQKQIRILKAFSGPAVWQSWAQSWREFTYSYELCHLAWTATFLCRKVQCITEASLLQIYLGAWWWTM